MEEKITEINKVKNKQFLLGLLCGMLITATAIPAIIFVIFVIQGVDKKGTEVSSQPFVQVEANGDYLIDDGFAEKAEVIYDGVIKEFYFEEDIDKDLMHENMYRAMVDSLKDDYAAYYSAEELEDLFTEMEGTYYGIGSYVSMDSATGYPILSGVFRGSPAMEAGLRDGDIIYEVNGVNHFGCTLTEWVNEIKGQEGTTVDLTIYREGEDDFVYVTVERRQIDTPTVNYEMLDNNIGYLQITEFDDVTYPQFKEAYAALYDGGMKAMVLDLRSNGGGNLDTVLEIAGEMLPEGLIAYTEDKNGNRQDYVCEVKDEIKIPVAILTNGYTASASELLTGAMRDYEKAISIGTRTFGKGIAQSIYPLADGSGVKITTDRFFTPRGGCIHGVGIEPDIEIEFDAESYYAEESVDNQLERAKEYLMGKM